MPELTVNYLVKIILGVLAFVVIVVGVSLVFKFYVFGFADNLPTGNVSSPGGGSGSGGVSVPMPSKKCVDCGNGWGNLRCDQKECEVEINELWKKYSQKEGLSEELGCRYTTVYFFVGKCDSVKIVNGNPVAV